MTARTGQAVRHALLSGGGGWPGVSLTGLEISADGRVELRRVPLVQPPVTAAPGLTALSGLALDPECGLYLSDADRRRIVRLGLDCGQRIELRTDELIAPAGLCVGPRGWLFVADPGRGAVLVLSRPDLTVRDVWTAGLNGPSGIAPDADRGVFVLDAGPARVLHLTVDGDVDDVVSNRLGSIVAPVAVATATDGALFVADRTSDAVLRFTRDGVPQGAPIAMGLGAGAISVAGDVLYVASTTTGLIYRIDSHTGSDMGAVAGFRGRVSAMAVARDGPVYIKTGPDDTVFTATPAAGSEQRGVLTAGPLDAGEEATWIRVAVDLASEDQTDVALEIATERAAHDAPTWLRARALDSRIDAGRYLWIRLTMSSRGGQRSPVIREVRAETDGDSYLGYLPEVYARDSGDGLIDQLLALAQARLGDLESALDAADRRLDPSTAPAEWLPWLASMQAFDVPESATLPEGTEKLRALLADVPELYERRGTPDGVAGFAEIYAGVRPTILEDFRSRRIWMLGHTSTLGFDTELLRDDPDGIVLGESVTGASGPEDPEAWGSALFDASAHRFSVLVPPGVQPGSLTERQLRRVLDAEKPAHTAYRLCMVEPQMRVGLQAHLGIDAIVAGPSSTLSLDGESVLGLERLTGEIEDGPGAIGRRSRLGIDTSVG